jgi:hypothetical protein
MEIVVNGKERINIEVSGKGIMNSFIAHEPTIHLNLTREEALKLRRDLSNALQAPLKTKILRTEFKLKETVDEPFEIPYERNPVVYTDEEDKWDADMLADQLNGEDVLPYPGILSEAEEISRNFWNETEKREALLENNNE